MKPRERRARTRLQLWFPADLQLNVYAKVHYQGDSNEEEKSIKEYLIKNPGIIKMMKVFIKVMTAKSIIIITLL